MKLILFTAFFLATAFALPKSDSASEKANKPAPKKGSKSEPKKVKEVKCKKGLIAGRWGDSVIKVASDGKTLTGDWDEDIKRPDYRGTCVGVNKV